MDWANQPDTMIDDFLDWLRLSGMSPARVRQFELRVKFFETEIMRSRDITVFELTPPRIRGYFLGLLGRGSSKECLLDHWEAVKLYLDFLVQRGMLLKNPALQKLTPTYGAELEVEKSRPRRP